MATVDLARAFEFYRSQEYAWVLSSIGVTSFNLSAGTHLQEFDGSFTQVGAGPVEGSVMATRYYDSVGLVYELTGLNSLDATTMQTLFQQGGNTQATFASMLAGADTLIGSSGSDGLLGYAGNDVLRGGAGDDTLKGGAGIDTMTGGAGDDVYRVDQQTYKSVGGVWVWSGDAVFEAVSGGLDTVLSSASAYRLPDNVERLTLIGPKFSSGFGNEMANLLLGNDRGNSLEGKDGNDTVAGAGGRDSLYGDDGNDLLSGGADDDSLQGGAGHDRILGGSGTDRLYAGSGNDRAWGGAGNDYLSGHYGYDTLSGGAGNDRLFGGVHPDTLLGGAGDDYLDGDTHRDLLLGGDGSDTLVGGSAIDTMNGGAGDDWYWTSTYYDRDPLDVIRESASAGSDTVSTYARVYKLPANVERLELLQHGGLLHRYGTGNRQNNELLGAIGQADHLHGMDGDDTLIGAGDNDVYTGGAGRDAFHIAYLADDVDKQRSFVRVADFAPTDDRFELAKAGFTGDGPLGALAAGAFRAGTAALDADDRVIYNAASGDILWDADGNGSGAAVGFAHVIANTALTAADFLLV